MHNELYHHGILGQRWGVRRYQNSDGTYTDEGLKRKNSYTSGATKRATKKLAKYEKADAKAKARYEKKTGNKYEDSDNDKAIRKAKETRVSANKDLDAKYQDIKESRSAGAKIASNLLAGPFANKAYQTLRASGDSKSAAMAKIAVTQLILPGGIGNLALSGITRSKYVDSNIESNKKTDTKSKSSNNKKEQYKQQQEAANKALKEAPSKATSGFAKYVKEQAGGFDMIDDAELLSILEMEYEESGRKAYK